MDAKAEALWIPRRLHQLHLGAVEADAIDVEAFTRRLDVVGIP